MKETFYFSHDNTAHSDPKIMYLITNCGLSAVGMYWIIIEILHQEPESKISIDDLKNYIKFFCQNENNGTHQLDKIEQVLIKSGLLLNNDGFVYSKRVLSNKEYRQEISEKRSMAGKKSAEIRAKATNVKQNLTSDEQGKERKGKESKVNKNNNTVAFAPPLLEEVKKYCQGRSNGVDSDKWYNFYSAKGWMIGKNKMKDWKAAVRTWEIKKEDKNDYIYINKK